MSKRPNRYKKKNKKNKNLNVGIPVSVQETIEEPEKKNDITRRILAVIFILFFGGLGIACMILPEFRDFSQKTMMGFIRIFPKIIYHLSGSLYIVSTLMVILIFILSDILPEKYAGLKTLAAIMILCFIIGLICKLIFYPEIFFIMIFAGYVIAHALSSYSAKNKIKWLLFWGVFFVLMASGVFVTMREHPYRLQGEISEVNFNERLGYNRGHSYFYTQIVYYIVEPDGKQIDGTRYASRYYVPTFFAGFTNEATDRVTHYYENRKGKCIWLLGKYEYVRGDTVPLREVYFMLYICFMSFVQFVLCLRDIRRQIPQNHYLKK